MKNDQKRFEEMWKALKFDTDHVNKCKYVSKHFTTFNQSYS